MTHRHTQILGHRGWSKRFPENTLIAFEQALQLGIDGLEFDVQLTKDGVPVIIHDPVVDRTTDGAGAISMQTLAELKTLNAAAHRPDSPLVGSEPIPTLDEVLAMVQRVNPNSLLNIELKVYVEDGRDLVDTVLQHVKGHPLENRILFSSFHHGCLDHLRSRSKTAQLGLLYEELPVEPWYLAHELGAWSINPGYKFASPEFMTACREHGLHLCLWTVDDPVHIQSFYDFGVDVLITNTPDTALRVRQEV